MLVVERDITNFRNKTIFPEKSSIISIRCLGGRLELHLEQIYIRPSNHFYRSSPGEQSKAYSLVRLGVPESNSFLLRYNIAPGAVYIYRVYEREERKVNHLQQNHTYPIPTTAT